MPAALPVPAVAAPARASVPPGPVSAAPVSAGPAARRAVALWGRAADGMSVEQVTALYPQASPSLPAALGDGAVARLHYVTNLSTGPAEVLFYFRGEELDAVLLHVLAVRPGADGNLATARAVRDSLTDTYGAPAYSADQSRGGQTRVNAQWTRLPLKVSLSYQDVADRRTNLWVAFRAWAWDARGRAR